MSNLYRIRHGCTGRYFAHNPSNQQETWIFGTDDVFETSNMLGYISRGDELVINSLIAKLSEYRLTKGFIVEEYDGAEWSDCCNHINYKTYLMVE